MPRHYPISIALYAWWLISCHVLFPPTAITLRLLPCLFGCKAVCVFVCFVLITLSTYSHVLPDMQDTAERWRPRWEPCRESNFTRVAARLQQEGRDTFPGPLFVYTEYRCLQVFL